MSIKIDAWYHYIGMGPRRRSVSESDWRKIMAVVKAAHIWYTRAPPDPMDGDLICDALYALERHLEKKKK